MVSQQQAAGAAAGLSHIGLIGFGQIGGTLAHILALKKVGKIHIFDTHKERAQGKIRDLQQALAIAHGDPFTLEVVDSVEDLAHCTVIVITAGTPRRPNIEREALLEDNARIVQNIGMRLRQCPSTAVVIMVTNPLDSITHWFHHVTQWAPQRIVGMAGVLDTGRLRLFLAQRLGVSPQDVQTWVIGAHNPSMIPLFSYTTVGGLPLEQWAHRHGIAPEELEALGQATKKEGATIVNLLGNGSAYYGPAHSIALMVRTIVQDEKRILPLSAYVDGPYGVSGTYLGVPAVLGAGGVQSIVEYPLTDEHAQALRRSAEDLTAQQTWLRGRSL